MMDSQPELQPELQPDSQPGSQPGVEPDRIDVNDEGACQHWAKKLDTTASQLRDAVAEVGDRATDVEAHLKGSRSTSNSDRVRELGG